MKTHSARSSLAVAVVVASLAWSSAAHAAGFAVNEVGSRPLGLAGAMTGLADDPSAVFFNPAGLATQSGLSLEASISLIAPSFTYDTTIPGTTTAVEVGADNRLFFMPSLYANYRIHERVAAGVGVYVPFGLGLTWNDTFEHNGATIPWWGRSMIREIDLQSVFINTSVAVKLHDRVYLGAGFVIAQAAVTLNRAVTASDVVDEDIHLKLSADDIGFGATAGVLVKLLPRLLHLGVAYRSAVKFGFEGNAAFTKGGSASAIPAGLRQRLQDGAARAELTVPHTISFGLAAFPMADRLALSFNLDVVTWSTYDELKIEFPDNPDLTTAEAKDWRNTVTVRLGAEYKVLENNLPVRLGFIYDQTPVPDNTVGPELPDVDRYLVALGVGYTFLDALRADLAYQFLISPDDDTADTAPIVGSRHAIAHIVSLGLAYRLDL